MITKKRTLFFFNLEIPEPYSDDSKWFFGRLECGYPKIVCRLCEECRAIVARTEEEYTMSRL